MPVAGDYMRVTFFGTLVDGVQPWSTSCWFRLASVAPGVAQTNADDLANVWSTDLKAEVLRLLASTDTVDGIKCDVYSPDTATLYDQGVHVLTDPTTGTTQLPPQIAVVATLITAGFGKAFRGRMYFPGTGNPTSDHRLDSSNTVGLANSLAAFFRDALSTYGLQGVLVSESRSAATNLTAVRVDDVYDTQRRRRDKVLSTKTQLTAI